MEDDCIPSFCVERATNTHSLLECASAVSAGYLGRGVINTKRNVVVERVLRVLCSKRADGFRRRAKNLDRRQPPTQKKKMSTARWNDLHVTQDSNGRARAAPALLFFILCLLSERPRPRTATGPQHKRESCSPY